MEFSEILSIYFSHYTIVELKENNVFLEAKATCREPQKDIKTSLMDKFTRHPLKDQWQITIEYDDMPFTFDSTILQQDEFFDLWNDLYSSLEVGESCNVIIVVTKQIHDGHMLLIYDCDAFFEYFSQLKPVECINVVSSHLKKCKGTAVFIAKGLSQPANTNTLFFMNEIPQQIPIVEVFHRKTWDRLKSVCHFSGIEDCIALPSDFNFVSTGSLPLSMIMQFEKCSMIILLSIFFDFMSISENMMVGKLNGYKSFEASFDVTQLKTNSFKAYYQIYVWLLAGGNLQDKMGIVRNLISLNVDPNDNYTLPESVYPSILSGFKVYERQNIKQYIELRNKMSDQLIGFNERAGKIAETFATSFEKSALAVLSLYASVIAIRVLSSKDLIGAFTVEATILSLVFLLFSLIYFFISRWNAQQQRIRYIDSYNNMKARNEDLLTKEDIERILNNGREYNSDLAMIDGRLRIYSILWMILLVLLVSFTLLMFYYNQNEVN